MEHETSDFDRWLRTFEEIVRGLQLVPALDNIAWLADEAFGARLWFAPILGRRWSYIAGMYGDDPSEFEMARVPLGRDIGLVSDTWGTLSEHERDRFIAYIRQLIP